MKLGSVLWTSLIALCSLWTGTVQAKTLKIGLLFKFAEEYDGTVPAMTRGIETAVAMFKKQHPDLNVEITKFPHQREIATIFQAIDAAIKAKVDVVIGGEDSNHAIPMSDRLGLAGIAFISPTATNPKVTANKPLAFAASMSDEHVAAKIGDFVVKHLKAERIGVMRGVSSPYTDFISQRFSESITKLNTGNSKLVLTQEKYVRGMLSYSEAIKKFQTANVTHLAMLSYETEFLQLLLQLKDAAYLPVLIGSDGWGSAAEVYERLFKKSGAVISKTFVGYQTAYWRDDPQHPLGKQFIAAYRQQYKQDPNAWSAVAFDATWVVLNAAKTAKNYSGTSLAAAMITSKSIPVATTDLFSFGPERSPLKSVPFYRIDASGVHFEAAY